MAHARRLTTASVALPVTSTVRMRPLADIYRDDSLLRSIRAGLTRPVPSSPADSRARRGGIGGSPGLAAAESVHTQAGGVGKYADCGWCGRSRDRSFGS